MGGQQLFGGGCDQDGDLGRGWGKIAGELRRKQCAGSWWAAVGYWDAGHLRGIPLHYEYDRGKRYI